MSETFSNRILPLLNEGTKIRIKEFEDMPEIPEATVTKVFEDGFGAMCSGVNMFESDDDFYLEIYDDNIDNLVEIIDTYRQGNTRR